MFGRTDWIRDWEEVVGFEFTTMKQDIVQGFEQRCAPPPIPIAVF